MFIIIKLKRHFPVKDKGKHPFHRRYYFTVFDRELSRIHKGFDNGILFFVLKLGTKADMLYVSCTAAFKLFPLKSHSIASL